MTLRAAQLVDPNSIHTPLTTPQTAPCGEAWGGGGREVWKQARVTGQRIGGLVRTRILLQRTAGSHREGRMAEGGSSKSGDPLTGSPARDSPVGAEYHVG